MKKPNDPEEQENIAVALKYDGSVMNAPQVVASGKGFIAEKIIEAAREFDIPVESDPVLAEALSQMDLGQEIPPELYQVVAEILVFIMETDRKLMTSD